MPRNSLILTLALILAPALAVAEREVRAFFFGNSLVHHLTDTDETTVPHWLALMAKAGGNRFAADGTWGFLQDFARDLPPEGKWSLAAVERVMIGSFRMAGFDTVILTPPNFIQYRGPEEALEFDNPRGDSPVDFAARTLDWAENQAPGARLWIYEGWADMGEIGFPPRARAFRRWHDFNRGDYHDWYGAFVAALNARLPDHDIRLIPVASTLAGLFRDGPLQDLGPRDLYSDDAPHGTPTTYLLAAMVTYATLYGEAPPTLDLPDTIAPLVRDRQAEVRAAIWAAVSGSAIRAEVTVPETGVEDPALAMGLNGISDWSTQMPFVDVMKTARPWTGHLPGQWGGLGHDDLAAAGALSPEGWLLAIPEGVEAIETFVLTDFPADFTSAAGRYRVTWAGQGDLALTGLARDVDMGANEAWFTFRPGPGTVGLRIAAVDPENPIRNISIVHEDLIPLQELGEVFNPAWIARVQDLRALRFMDWMMTNGSEQQVWEDRPRPSDYTWAWRGVPVEVMVRLANETGADPWFTLPHRADDAYVRAFATEVRETLDSRRHVHAEWSNEVWNFIFPQTHWAAEQARARWGEGEDHWMQFAGLRAAEVADIWAEVWAEDRDRLVTVVSTHTGWPGLEVALLDAPLAVAEGRARPHQSFDAYAVTGYYGFEIGEENYAEGLRAAIDRGEGAAQVTADLRDGSLGALIRDVLPHHAAAAAERGLRLMMYEGGTHVVGHGATVEDEALTAFFTGYNYGPETAALHADLLAGWQAAGGTMFNAFVDVSAPSKWGSWGALRHLDDANPRSATLMAWNVSGGAHWETRPAGSFAQGVLRRGTDGAEMLDGTAWSDLILAGAGDDRIVAGAGDRVHGGPGADVVVLPGTATDWTEAWQGEALVLSGPLGRVTLVSVEAVEFADGTTRQLMEGG